MRTVLEIMNKFLKVVDNHSLADKIMFFLNLDNLSKKRNGHSLDESSSNDENWRVAADT